METPSNAVLAAQLPEAEAVRVQASSENFPVAPFFLPRASRQHLRAIYGFARLVDDVGDETTGDRKALLEELEIDLRRVFEGTPQHPLLVELAESVRAVGLPEQPFFDLVEANRRDQQVSRYANWEELAEYCEYSANPVGRLVLHVFGAATARNIAYSDAICTALQLIEHCQDVAEDAARGRFYLPIDERARFACGEEELHAPQASPALRALLAYQIDRVRRMLAQGSPLVSALRGRARLAVAGFVAGGYGAAHAVERCGFDVLGCQARTRRSEVVKLALRIAARGKLS